MKKLILTTTLAIVMVGCTNVSNVESTKNNGNAKAEVSKQNNENSNVNLKEIKNTSWKLVSISGEKIKVNEEFEGITLDFKENEIDGNAGVNNYFGSFSLNSNKISFGSIGSTRMAGSPELLNLEMKYLKVLQGVTNYYFENDNLVLKNGNESLVFEKNN